MTFPATITLTIAGVAKVLNRQNQDNYGSSYQVQTATEQIDLQIRHSKDSKDADGMVMKRHNVFVEWVIFPTGVDLMKKFTYSGNFRHGSMNDPIVAADLLKAVGVFLAASTNAVDLTGGAN
nr:MAG: hypothetical protein 2 [Leviviridae sp.]